MLFAFISFQKAEIWQEVLARIFTPSLFWAKRCPASSFWKSLKSSALQADESPEQHSVFICPFLCEKLIPGNGMQAFRNGCIDLSEL